MPVLAGDARVTVSWAAVLLVVTLVGAVFGIVMHTLIVRSWLIGMFAP